MSWPYFSKSSPIFFFCLPDKWKGKVVGTITRVLYRICCVIYLDTCKTISFNAGRVLDREFLQLTSDDWISSQLYLLFLVLCVIQRLKTGVGFLLNLGVWRRLPRTLYLKLMETGVKFSHSYVSMKLNFAISKPSFLLIVMSYEKEKRKKITQKHTVY